MRFIVLLLLAGLLQGCVHAASTGERTGGLVAQDRRDSEARTDDRAIETRAGNLIYAQTRVLMHVNVTSFNRRVLISGEVPTEAARGEVEKIVSSVEKVSEVMNELVVSGNSSLLSRSNDSLIASNVKLRFVTGKQFDANHIKVVTENGTVFLMGIVNRSEGGAAAEAASAAKGVQRVVTIFEYLD